VRDLSRPGRVRVGEGQRADAVERPERPGVEGADPSDADHPNMEQLRHGGSYNKR
jgi:hypothetical protein